MQVSIKSGIIEAPPKRGVSKVEVRDKHGNLLVFCIEMPGGIVFVSRVGEEDFEWNAQNHGIPLVTQDQDPSDTGGIILG